MIVVADTSPLNYLVRLGAIGVLPRLYGHVLLPEAVVRELQDSGASLAVRDWAGNLPEWVGVIELEPSAVLELPRLGRGESEAITLGVLRRADLLLVDDGPARKVAVGCGLTVTGTLGVLRDAADERLLNFRESVIAIRRLGFRMTDALLAEMLSDIEGS